MAFQMFDKLLRLAIKFTGFAQSQFEYILCDLNCCVADIWNAQSPMTSEGLQKIE